MPGSLSMRWLVFIVCGALTAFGCATDTQGESGSLSLDLVINGDTEIDEVQWSITRGGEEIKSGTINTSANGATASVEAYGLEPGDGYTITLEAVSTDKETTCKGSTMFDIKVAEVTVVSVIINCKLPPQFGGVRVNGEFNICPYIDWADVSPMTTSVGNDIDLSATAKDDDEGDTITYMWSSGSGIIANPMAQSTTYTCTDVGDDVIFILVTDDGGTYCMDMLDFPVTCVAGDGDPCDKVICEDTGNECTTAACNPGTGLCETSNVPDNTDCDGGAGMCMGGECVPKEDPCMDVVCEDTGNECTTAACNPDTSLCETSNVAEGTPCGDGGACMGGTCIEEDPCDTVTCDDTMNDCTVEVCNSQTGMCDLMNVPDQTTCNDDTGVCVGGVCEVGDECVDVNCDSGNDCVDGGTCNPSNGVCEGGGDIAINEPCADGVCDGQGACVECNDGTQCPDDSNECTTAACDTNTCGQANVVNGMVCDFVGVDDGVCEDGTCVDGPDCTMDAQCDDFDVCTVNTCPDGMCVTQPGADGVECDADGTPGSCQSGLCVALCANVTCPDNGIECVTDECNPANGECEGVDDPDNSACDAGGGPDSGLCSSGTCMATSLGPFTNALTCDDGIAPAPDNCDYGCTALANTFGFAAILNVDPDDATTGGSASAVAFDGEFVISEAFIAGAEDALMADLNTANVNPGATLPVSALSGTTAGGPTTVTLPAITLDLDLDPDGNTVPGPFPLPFVPIVDTYTFGASGSTACFNLTTGINFVLTVTELNGGPTFIPAAFNCQPANQVAINADPAVITPEPTAGQVCFTIP
ncbi:MAG: hypothetical protein OES69_09855 [Myxococcales bacterium]|nr:hypothetical protein [Myxococcales bacterium]MDH3844231.1 hypothetical protein [Myxococcales bacterium]